MARAEDSNTALFDEIRVTVTVLKWLNLMEIICQSSLFRERMAVMSCDTIIRLEIILRKSQITIIIVNNEDEETTTTIIIIILAVNIP